MRKLTYIWHDCFVYTDHKVTMVFDYWKDTVAGNTDVLPAFLASTESSKPLYIIVSHHHKDHFTREIFKWSKHFSNIKYILSKDVAKASRHILTPGSIYSGPRPDPASVTILKPGEVYSDAFVKVEAYGSTDIGNSYAVEADGTTLFHAGDLNAWIWKDESTEKEVDKAIMDFKAILEVIKSRHEFFDLAMFPVDSRIGSEYYTGAKIFVGTFVVKHFFPMHFGLGETPAEQKKYMLDASKIDLYANPDKGEYICLQAPYSSFAMPSSPRPCENPCKQEGR